MGKTVVKRQKNTIFLDTCLDTSLERKLPCPTQGKLTVRSSLIIMQFGEVLKSVALPTTWREVIAERCRAGACQEDDENERIRKRRAELDAE
jgi:hypothetical protein